MTQNLQVWQKEISTIKSAFNEINDVNKFVNYKSEVIFASQIIRSNHYLEEIANSNPASLRAAVINIASIGLSLNPATKYAYLVPRGGGACLDISYMGLIKLATDTGAIQWARAELVRENDIFTYKGACEKPEFSAPKPFDRGEVVGVYCVAKTIQNDYLSGIMSLKEINEIKDRSKASTGPWVTDFGEMAKKTIIKRESKTWPKTEKSDRFYKAVEIANAREGIDFKEQISTDPVSSKKVFDAYLELKEIVDADVDEMDFERAQNLYRKLSSDEQMAVFSKFGKTKADDCNRSYRAIIKKLLTMTGKKNEQ